MENVILVGCILGPIEPKGDINACLKPLVDELLEQWTQLHTNSTIGYTSVWCALSCITDDLPATRKFCGFESLSAQMGCSKCLKKFKSSTLWRIVTLDMTKKIGISVISTHTWHRLLK